MPTFMYISKLNFSSIKSEPIPRLINTKQLNSFYYILFMKVGSFSFGMKFREDGLDLSVGST